MSRTRRFLNQPQHSQLQVTIAIDPPGSVGIVTELAVNGSRQGPQAGVPGTILSFPCNQAKSTFEVRVDLAWLQAGRASISTWLFDPTGLEVLRTPIIFDGTPPAVDFGNIVVATA